MPLAAEPMITSMPTARLRKCRAHDRLGQAAPVELPALAEAATLTAKADAVLDAIAAGTLAPDVGATLIGAIAAAARVAEVAELAARLEAIERALSARKEAKP